MLAWDLVSCLLRGGRKLCVCVDQFDRSRNTIVTQSIKLRLGQGISNVDEGFERPIWQLIIIRMRW